MRITFAYFSRPGKTTLPKPETRSHWHYPINNAANFAAKLQLFRRMVKENHEFFKSHLKTHSI